MDQRSRHFQMIRQILEREGEGGEKREGGKEKGDKEIKFTSIRI